MLRLVTKKNGFSGMGNCLSLGLSKQYYYFILNGKNKYPIKFGPWKKQEHDDIVVYQQNFPFRLGVDERKTYWLFSDKLYWTHEILSNEDVHALLLDKERRKRRTIERAQSRVNIELSSKVGRASIPDDVKTFVWQRDKGRCVKCDSNEKLEFDHIIPLSMGGSDTARNIQLLCEICNREKGGNLI